MRSQGWARGGYHYLRRTLETESIGKTDLFLEASKMNPFSGSDLSDLKSAKWVLEHPGYAATLADWVGKPIEKVYKYLPDDWREKVNSAVQNSLLKGLEFTIHTMSDGRPHASRDWLHKMLVAGSGAAGGAFGFVALPVELPISTCLILRSIADIARSEGHDLSRLEVRLSCLIVLALGGRSDKDNAAESGYWVVRAALARAVSEAAAFIAERGAVEEGAPPLVRLILAIAARFGVIVGEEVAAKAVPILGAAGGATINFLFMAHFQDMARGHFIVKRLEDKYSSEAVMNQYNAL